MEIKTTVEQTNIENETNNNMDDSYLFEKFFEEFFYDMMNSKDADVISARNYLSKSIDPQKSFCTSVKNFLHNLFLVLYKEEMLYGYYAEYMAFVSAEKIGWFKYEQFEVAECLVTVLQNAFVSKDVMGVQQKLVRAAFAYMNNSYGAI